MHVVIPMSGIGKRFLDAGYALPKPLIVVDGKPMISFVVNMFPGETKFTFICNREHLETTPLRAVLEGLAPGGRIVSIEPHKKGPVWAVSEIFGQLDDEEEVIVNYCDFYSDWDYSDFLNDTRGRYAEGAVPSYRGFHPHMLGTDNYAFIKDENRWLQAIQEKKPFTDNRMAEFASNGTYYFRRGRHVKKYFAQLMNEDIQINGEFYVSMIYNLMVRDGLPVSVYEVPHMLQWGTPGDLQIYQKWSDCFRDMVKAPPVDVSVARNSITLIPMAGRGNRFVQAGYTTSKPLIPVSGKPMVVQATADLPPSERTIFAVLADVLVDVEAPLKEAFPNCTIVPIETVTGGQASTCAVGLLASKPEVDGSSPLLIGACDNGMMWNAAKYKTLVNDPSVDAIAFSFRNHPGAKRNPEMYGWMAVDADGRITKVSVKKPVSEHPENDHAIAGAFFFRSVELFLGTYDVLISNQIKINGEFYVDSMIGVLVEAGYRCHVLELDQYICWGTPNDLKTFQYWQEFFDKCPWHPYRLDLDPDVCRLTTSPM